MGISEYYEWPAGLLEWLISSSNIGTAQATCARDQAVKHCHYAPPWISLDEAAPPAITGVKLVITGATVATDAIRI